MAYTLPTTGNDNLTPPFTGDGFIIGQPTQPGLARSQTANTTLSATNSDLAHVCDITGDMRYSIALVSFKISEAIQTIRTELEAIWANNSSSPFGNQIKIAVGYIKAKLTMIKGYIEKANDARDAAQKFIAEAEALIAYIASLPARIAKQLTACVAGAIASIKDAVSNSASIVKSQQSGTTSSASSQVTDVSKTLTDTEEIVVPEKITPEVKIP